MPPTRHAHISGRFDADRAAFTRYVQDVVTRGRCTSFTTTETYGSLVGMRSHLDGWIITRRGEYVIGVRRDTYRRTKWSKLMRLSQQYRGREEWRDLFVHRRTFVHLETGRPVIFIAAHAPSHVEIGRNWRVNSQAEASRAGLTKLGLTIARLRVARPRLVVVVGMDTNMDHREDVWRQRATSMLGLPSMWDERRPASGTHEARVIDVIYSNVPMSAGHVSNAVRPAKVDHRAIAVALDLTA